MAKVNRHLYFTNRRKYRLNKFVELSKASAASWEAKRKETWEESLKKGGSTEDDRAAMGISPTGSAFQIEEQIAAEIRPMESLEDLIKQTDRETLDLLAQWTAVEAGEPTPTRTAQSLLLEAAEIVGGDRQKTHGEKERSFEVIAEFWNIYLENRIDRAYAPARIRPEDVAQMMVLLKIARSIQGSPILDHYIDEIGYGAIVGELWLARMAREKLGK